MVFSFKNALQGQAPVNGSGLCSFIRRQDAETVPNTRILHPPEHFIAGIDRFFLSIRKKKKPTFLNIQNNAAVLQMN